MKNIFLYRFGIVVAVLCFIAGNLFSQVTENPWTDNSQKFILEKSKRSGIPDSYRSVKLDLNAMSQMLNGVIHEDQQNAFVDGPVIRLPLSDGRFSSFVVAKSALMPDELSAKFPMIRTFTAKGIDDSTAVAKLDITEHGFHAMIVSSSGWTIIDPAFLGNTSDYICFDRIHSRRTGKFLCDATDILPEPQKGNNAVQLRTAGSQLKTYRLGVACTGEYAAFFGGTVSAAMSGIVTSVNRVSGVYELEMAVRFTLIPNNNLVVYTNAGTDPYTNGSASTMLGQNQTTFTNVIGSANYDIGHVFGIGSGGVASLGVVCSSTNKARGVTGNASPIGDNFDIDYVAHEIGHQFGGSHTFNGVLGNCAGNRSSTSAYEPGSGTTIMAYAGICDADDIQPHSDAIFHARSFDQIQTFITTPQGGSTCPVVSTTGNSPPVINVGSNYSIPLNTPFVLTGSATDANNDPLTFLWEEYDLGPAGSPNSPSGNAPIFRDFVPVTSPSRTFPRMQDLINNTQTLGEILPTYARSLAFRLTVRDNRPGGGGVTNNNTPVSITVVNTVTPFTVTIPNTALSWPGNTMQTVTWDVSSTNASPINCAVVNILLSVDGGNTYPHTLATNTANDGSQSVLLPNVVSTTARVKVEAAGNIFFDISNVNFSITCAVNASVSISANPVNAVCAGTPVNFHATPVNGGTTPVYQWKVNNINAGTNDDDFSYAPVHGDIVKCVMTSNLACVVNNPVTSNQVTMQVISLPSVANHSPMFGGEGTELTINGTGFTGTSSVSINGTPVSFSVVNDQQIVAQVSAAVTSGTVNVVTNCGADAGTDVFTVIDHVDLNLKMFINGFYQGNETMVGIISPAVCDTVEVFLASATSPYTLLYSDQKTISINGEGTFTFPGGIFARSFYIVVRHRNTIETWSKLPVTFSSFVNSFDFTR